MNPYFFKPLNLPAAFFTTVYVIDAHSSLGRLPVESFSQAYSECRRIVKLLLSLPPYIVLSDISIPWKLPGIDAFALNARALNP
jgi:hypothetical protein